MKSKLDPVHMLQMAFDEESKSFSMHMNNLEMSMELNADDGDSVVPQKKTIEIQASAGQIIDVSKYSKICMVGQETVDIKAVMSDNSELALMSLTLGVPKDLCMPRIKIMSQCYIILQS